MAVAEGSARSFRRPPGRELRVRVSKQQGENGFGTIAEADVDPDLLHFFLHACPGWNSLAEKRLQTGATGAKCVRKGEAALGLKTEIAGIVGE
eukprot:3659884-Pyramimonas_sp.AAC.1